MKLVVVVKINFQVLLVPDYGDLRHNDEKIVKLSEAYIHRPSLSLHLFSRNYAPFIQPSPIMYHDLHVTLITPGLSKKNPP